MFGLLFHLPLLTYKDSRIGFGDKCISYYMTYIKKTCWTWIRNSQSHPPRQDWMWLVCVGVFGTPSRTFRHMNVMTRERGDKMIQKTVSILRRRCHLNSKLPHLLLWSAMYSQVAGSSMFSPPTESVRQGVFHRGRTVGSKKEVKKSFGLSWSLLAGSFIEICFFWESFTLGVS